VNISQSFGGSGEDDLGMDDLRRATLLYGLLSLASGDHRVCRRQWNISPGRWTRTAGAASVHPNWANSAAGTQDRSLSDCHVYALKALSSSEMRTARPYMPVLNAAWHMGQSPTTKHTCSAQAQIIAS